MVRSEAKMHTDKLRIKAFCQREKDEDGIPHYRYVASMLGLSDRQTKIDMEDMGLCDD